MIDFVQKKNIFEFFFAIYFRKKNLLTTLAYFLNLDSISTYPQFFITYQKKVSYDRSNQKCSKEIIVYIVLCSNLLKLKKLCFSL